MKIHKFLLFLEISVRVGVDVPVVYRRKLDQSFTRERRFTVEKIDRYCGGRKSREGILHENSFFFRRLTEEQRTKKNKSDATFIFLFFWGGEVSLLRTTQRRFVYLPRFSFYIFEVYISKWAATILEGASSLTILWYMRYQGRL